MFKDMSRLYGDNCITGMEYLSDAYGNFVDAIITSPPYAEQRKNQYGGISEKDYPDFTVDWMRRARKLLKPDGSVFINIRPHIKNGEISDYVLKTRLALREDGWKECEELIWIKPDSPPLGSINRPRRAWESILWFSPTNKPFADVKAGGTESNRIGYENNKFEHGGNSHIHAGQNKARIGKARVRDYIEAGTGKVEKGFKHSAMFPPEVPRYLIDLSVKPDGFVLDPFTGSGTTLREAVRKNIGFVGFENNREHFKEAEKSILKLIIDENKTKDYLDFIEINGSEDD